MAAVNPSDPGHIVVATQHRTLDRTDPYRVWDFSYVTRDGGASWKVGRIPGGPAAGPTHPLFHTLKMSDPVAAALSDGTVLYAGLASREGAAVQPPGAGYVGDGAIGVDLFVARSTDGGLTFPEVRIMEQGPGPNTFTPVGYAGVLTADKPWFGIGSGGMALLAWTVHDAAYMSEVGAPAATHGSLRWSVTLDGGKTWSTPKTMAGGPGMRWGAIPAIGSNGTWYVSYAEWQNAQSLEFGDFVVAVSKDRGATWEPRPVDRIVDQFPQLAVGNDGGRERLVAVYSSDENGKRNPVLAVSTDEGRTWSTRLRLSPASHNGLPIASLAVGDGGLAYVSFWNATKDGTLERRLVAMNGNRVLAEATLDSGVRFVGGEYQGQVALPTGTATVWTREDAAGKSNVLFAKYEWH